MPELSFDIYGKGGEEGKLRSLIDELGRQTISISKGNANLEKIYKNYEVYLSASTSEGFGLTLMEAIGSGLPIIGFDVPYGNQTFVTEGKMVISFRLQQIKWSTRSLLPMRKK